MMKPGRKRRGGSRILSVGLAALMMLSAVLSDTSESLAADVSSNEKIEIQKEADSLDIRSSDISGSTISSSDGADAEDSGGSDGESADASVLPEPLFYVEGAHSDIIRGYGDWSALLTAFAEWGELSEEYTVTVAKGGVVGTTLPAGVGKITLLAAAENDVLLFSGDTVNMTGALTIGAASVSVSGTQQPVNINTKGKALTLYGTKHLGTVKGTSAGSLILNGEVEIQGNLQTFKSVTLTGSLTLGGNLSAVANLDLQQGTVYLSAGKSFTAANVTAGEGGVLSCPRDGALPTVKITGTVQGVLGLKQYAEENGQKIEKNFAAGSKLLTANKATAEQFALYGERQVCYKKGSLIYAGAEVLQLYGGDALLGTYAQWSDVVAKINSLNQANTSYTIRLLDDFVINGAMTMPGKGKYGGMTLESAQTSTQTSAQESGEESTVSLKVTGKLTLTSNLTLGSRVLLEAAGAVSGAAWRLQIGEQSSVTVKGAVTLGELYMKEGTSLRTGGKLTVKKTLSGADGAELILTQKKGAALKDTLTEQEGALRVRVLDSTGKQVTLAQGTTLFAATGNSYAAQFHLLGADNQTVALYKKGNAIKVQGSVATPVTLYCSTGESEQSLGEYESLADVKTEIARRKDSTAAYRVEIREQLFVKGAIPLPTAGTYRELQFTGAAIRTTGNLTLTGDVIVKNEIRRVKSEQDSSMLPWIVNVSKYTLTIPDGNVMPSLGAITGTTGSCLRLGTGSAQKINGNVKVETLVLGREVQVTGSITVTDIYPESGNCLVYDLNKAITVKGTIGGDGNKLVLCPLKNGQQLSSYTEALRVLNSASKVQLERLQMAQSTDYVFYKDGAAVRLGTPVVRVFAGTLDAEDCQGADAGDVSGFVRMNDAGDYINSHADSDFVVRLEKDIASTEALVMPASGKHIVLCGLNGEARTLRFSGAITLDGSSLAVRNVKLDNRTSLGPNVSLLNGASVLLQDTAVNSLSASVGSTVTLAGKVSIGGTVSGACDMTIQAGSVVSAAGNIAVKRLALSAASDAKSRAEIRLLTGKKLTVSDSVNTGGNGIFLINQVNKSDELATVSAGTVMVVTQNGEASQFKTENIMPDSFAEWALVKVGTEIQTVAGVYDDGEWSGDYY